MTGDSEGENPHTLEVKYALAGRGRRIPSGVLTPMSIPGGIYEKTPMDFRSSLYSVYVTEV